MARHLGFRVRRWLPWVLAGVATLAALDLMLVSRWSAQELERWRSDARFATVQGRKIRYEYVPGKETAPLVVLIPGWAAGADLGKPLIGHVGASTLCYDACGVALSQGREGGCDGPQYADELAELTTQVAPGKKLVLIGYSFSSIAARAFVERYPDRVAGLVLLDPNLPEHAALDPATERFYSQLYNRFAFRLYAKSLFGLTRLERFIHHAYPTESVARRVSDIDVNAAHWYTVWSTRWAMQHARSEALVPGRWRDLPLLVIGANLEKNPRFRGVLTQLMAQSSNASLFEVSGDHSHLLDSPKVGPQVMEQIAKLVAKIH